MRLPLPLLVVVVLGVGCGDDLPPPADPRGSLRVTLLTTGGDVDQDGYDLLLDEVIRHHLSPNGSVTIRDLVPGTYRLALSGVAANCDVVSSQPTTVTVNASVAQAALSVQCFATGISVRTVTTGPDPHPDGYTLTVGGLAIHIDANTTRVVSRLAEETHQLGLIGVASHCIAAPGNPGGTSSGAQRIASLYQPGTELPRWVVGQFGPTTAPMSPVDPTRKCRYFKSLCQTGAPAAGSLL